ncbi:Retrovirus-related Pol polyprotein from transposon TNT 1-94 [Vitis vinifera]|uniref:Retrovirus-related Pol polyprotein from transposon TNT 1-94 n=1 Tax=Vitis vinifera TaxID=29760 RepID=A0A438G4K3_VITVI|nr:Retrovirus-related Pol polyprotein from transposon TNT 1-94 [Vitis vinifera]
MAEEAGKASGIEKFDGTDFAYWRMQIEDYLYGRKLHLPLLGTKPESMKAEEWALLDRQPSANNKVHLMKKLFNLKMAENASVAQHLNEFNTITNQLSSVEIDFDDEIRALIVLASLPNSWEAMRMAVSNSTGKEKLKYNDIRDLILAEEIRRRDAGETSGSGSALNLETRGRGNNRNSNQGRSNSRNSNRNRSKSRSGQQVQCWNCGKTGHFKRQCKSPKKKNEDDSANAVTEEVQDALLLAVDSPLDDWVLDSGASFHTTPHREIIQNYVAGDFGKVYLADGSALDVVGLGDVRISLPNGSVWLLEKVRHIPDLRRNLISVGQLDDEGHAILFVGGTWKVTKGARVLARGKKTGTLYMTSCPRDTIAVADASTDTSLWHRRLGHMSEKGMKMLLSKGKLPELKSIDFDMCESCILGKQKKVSFLKTGRTPKAEKLELVHTDLWGPSPVASLGGSRYYITLLMTQVERSDNGGEYIDGGFSEYCAAQGIRMEKTIPGTPQQNAYLINRGPSVPMEFRLPEEVWSGKEVKFSHLKVFGCVSYVHIDSDARSKLDAKSKICFFIGYGDEKFGYRFWDEQNRKIIRSRNVIFNEQVMYKDRSTVTSDVTEIDQKKSEFVNLDELTESTVQKGGEEDKENVNSQVDLSTPVAEVRRSSRNIRPPQRYSPVLNYLLLTDGGEPECYDEALQDENSSKWELAMKDEMDSLLGNQTWELTELPVGKKALHNKWVYRIKNEHDGSKRYKARLVVKGFQQKEGIDYTEIFSPVVKMSTIRLVLGMVAVENLHLEQLDVKTAFLHGDLEEDLYMIQPEGFIVQGQENLVCKLRKSLYGLKQAPRQWYKKFDNFMHRIGFKRCEADHCCYVKSFDNSYIILLLYVDDMLIAGSDIEKINNLKKQLSKQFAMKDLGAAKQILGMRIIRDKANGTLKLSQSEYVKKVLSRFNMNEAKPVSTPLGSHFKLSKEQSPKTEEERDHMSKVPYASAIGSLMYAMVCTRPDIAHAVGVVSRFMSRPGKQHWEAVKWILRYLKGSLDTCLCFTGGTAISWTSNLQKIVTLSTTEAEYVAATEAGKEMIWLHGFLDELVKNEESYEESWAKLRIQLPRVNPDCKEKKQRESVMKPILDDSRSSHFWALSEVQMMQAIYHFKAQEVKNPMLQTVCNSELKRRSCSHYKPVTLKCCGISLLLREFRNTFVQPTLGKASDFQPWKCTSLPLASLWRHPLVISCEFVKGNPRLKITLNGINFVDHFLNQGAPAEHKSAETPIGHESNGAAAGE